LTGGAGDRHSRINDITPQQHHSGEDPTILAHRQALYEQAKAQKPRRQSGSTRNPCGSHRQRWAPAQSR